MGRYEDYQNLIDAKILQGLQWSATLEVSYDADEHRYYLNASYNSLKALKDANTNIVLHLPDNNADLYIPLAVLYYQPADTPPTYGAYFLGVVELEFVATDPDADLFYDE